MTSPGHSGRLDGAALTILFACRAPGVPGIVYLGPRLEADEDIADVAAAARFGRHEAQPDDPSGVDLLPQSGRGFGGTPALVLRSGDALIMTAFALTAIEARAGAIRFCLADRLNDLDLTIDWSVMAGDVVRAAITLSNAGAHAVAVDRLASLALPLPDWATMLTRFAGRWAGEMRALTQPIEQGGCENQSRGGKPGFSGGNWLVVGEARAGGDVGRMVGVHVAWSGDTHSLVERDADGATQVQIGCRLDQGEIMLAPGELFTPPEAYFALSMGGRDGLRRAFHAHARADILSDRAHWGPRKVHLNSWDALGFDFDEARLIALADDAAAIGVERFVLDDGWFAGRRNDSTSLGDWTPDRARFPHGLDPLIERVKARGMEFGLWVEPEMISPDSDLYRAHPDWCLCLPGQAPPTQRRQLVLDLTRAEVVDHLFGVLDGLLADHAIAYLKWDHNRDLFPLANAGGAIGHAQTTALYALLDRMRAAHPLVEIETCSSGGGRIDLEILKRCHRVWPSDNNDPAERLRIDAAWGLFLPPEIIGTHVGPATNPVTGRSAPIDFRAKVALFGHMGVEAHPGKMNEAERATLAEVIALYKQWRWLLHSGAREELAFDDPGVSGALVRGEAAALVLVARTDFAAAFGGQRVRMAGFEPGARYRIRLLEPWPVKASLYLSGPAAWRAGRILSGAVLAETGLAIPLAHPDTAWLIAIERQ